MSKDDFIAAHEAEIEEYLETHPGASWSDAYDLTADRAYDRMRETLADRVEALRQRMKEEGHG